MSDRLFFRVYILAQLILPFGICWGRWQFLPALNFDLILTGAVGGFLVLWVMGFVKMGLSVTRGGEKVAWTVVVFILYSGFLIWTLALKVEPDLILGAQSNPSFGLVIRSRIDAQFTGGREAANLYLLSQGTTAALVGLADLVSSLISFPRKKEPSDR